MSDKTSIIKNKLYLASHLGFSSEYLSYRDKIKCHIIIQGLKIYDPWDNVDHKDDFAKALEIMEYDKRLNAMKRIAMRIGLLNENLIRESDVLLAVLDGTEVDSGVASEVGFATGLGKICYGLRTDFRNCGEMDGIPINLQVLHFIEKSGGKLFRAIDDIKIHI